MNGQGGLYFHIPFCRNKCPYCDFYSVKHCAAAEERYTDEVIAAMQGYSGRFDTVYFGGGTPSLLAPSLLGRILSAARERFTIDENSEITVECNPREDLREAFLLYRSYGVNRISLGMQSAVDSERFALGRVAGRKEVERTIRDARSAGIENISLDLMLGIPHQTEKSLTESLDFIAATGVSHVSAYLLKIEEGTPFYQRRKTLALPDEDATAALYFKAVEGLEERGLLQYEISNFARPGFESRHNLKYWKLVPYLGIGKSAHSFWGGRRFYYDTDWVKHDDGAGGTDEERIMLGLRLTEGIDASLLTKPYEEYIRLGLLTERNGRIALTKEGMLVSNAVIAALI